MIPFLAFMATKGLIDGEAAIGVARRFLVRMDVLQPGELQGLYEQKGANWGRPSRTVWSVGFGSEGVEQYYVSLDDDGTVFRAGRSDGGQNLSRSTNAEAAKRFQRGFMARVPNARPVRSHRPPESFYADGQFDVLVNGLTFFNINPSYCYSFGVAPDGSLVSFTRGDRTPPVVSATPTISQSSAVAKLTQVWGKTPHQEPFPQHVRVELGYYIRKGENTARLVYRGLVYNDRTPLFDGAGVLEELVDASSGQVFRRDDN